MFSLLGGSKKKVVAVKLDPNGGSYTSNGVTVYTEQVYTNVYYGKKIVELPTPVKDSSDFEGWYDGDTKYTYESVITVPVTLKAKWTDHLLTVTFDPTEGKMAGDTEYTIAEGKTFTYLPGANCVDEASSVMLKSFDGWYTEPGGNGKKLVTDPTVAEADPEKYVARITEDTTKFYAKWVDNRVQDDDYSSLIRWGTLSGGDVTNVGDTLVFHPQGAGNVSAHLSVDFSQNNNIGLPAGSVKITLPRKLFQGWDGTDKTIVNDVFDSFNVISGLNDKDFVLVNSKEFQSTSLEPVYTVDPMLVKGGFTDENGIYQNYYKDSFEIKIEVKDNPNDPNSAFHEYQKRTLGVEFHTEVNTRIQKDQSTATLTWDSNWGNKPADADEYFYVIWNLKSFNTNSTQPYKLCWSENTVHDGSVVYSYAPGLDTWSAEYNSDSSNVMKIVTKHPLKEAIAEGAWAEVTNEAILDVEWKSGYVEQFRTTGKAQAFVGEVFPDGIRSLEKNIPDYGTQSKHYISGGQDLVLNGSVDKLGELKYNIIYHEEDNGDNPGWSEAGEMVITPRNYVFSDGVKGRNDVLISGAKDSDSTNKNLWNAAGQTQLDDGDYNFTSLEIIINEYDSVMVSEDENKKHWASPYPNNNLADYGNVIVSTRKAGSTDFSVLKTFLRSDLTALDDGGYKVSIDLPSDCVGYKVSYTSLRYSTEVKINTGLKLKNTTKIRTLTSEHVSAGKDTLIKNKAQVDIAREGFMPIVCDSTEFSPWRSTYELTLSESELWAAKSCLDQTKMSNDNKRKYFETDEVASTVEFPVAITGWTFSNNQIGSYKRVTSGTFHDLLPYGFVVDKSKIIVCGRTEEQASQRGSTTMNSQKSSANANSYSDSATVFPGIISSDYYSVRFEDNWEGSGQTMMIIDISCPDDMIATGFVVYYKCKTTINNLHINGTTPKNYVAFRDTTPNQGLPDTRKQPRLDDSTARSLFASVDNEQTAYCFGTTTLDTPNVYQYGADSNVHTEGAVMARHQVVGLNTDYTYHISYEGSTSTKTANLVIYDIIERQIGGKESEWYGEFNEVDISKIKQQPSNDAADGTCAPVVYYLSSDTIAKDAITEEMFDLDYEIEGNKIWTTEKPDNSKVVAIAVDCRKTSKNKDFVLGVRQGVDFTINMNSPAHSDRSEINTYNEAVIKGFNPEIGKNIKLYARTSVTLRFMNPVFVKSAYPASGTKDSPEPVVKDSTMDYVLSITNPDKELPMNNVIVEDEFPAELVPLNNYKVSFNDGDKIDIDGTRRVDYTLINKKDSEDKVVSRVFTATVDVLDPGEKVEITIPVKVGLQKDERITNKARITSINGVPYSELFSNETYHVVTGVKAKILKVNSKDEPLEGATLKIYKNNETNFDDDGKLKADASPVMLNTGGEESVGSFTSTDKVMYFDIEPGSYVLVEDAIPVGTEYKPSANIPFTVDVYGVIKVNGERVNYVKMVDEPPFKIVFHENKPGGTPADKQKSFKVVEKMDLNALSRINAFTDVPDCAGDEYVFVGWYHDSEFTQRANPDSAESGANVKADFGETYSLRENVEDPDYHLYAKWTRIAPPDYMILFHHNRPEGTYNVNDTAHGKQEVFKAFDTTDLVDGMIPHFYDIPEWAKDDWVFAGWYHNADYRETQTPDNAANRAEYAGTAADFEHDGYLDPNRTEDYHLYAKWIEVGSVNREPEKDDNIIDSYRGFGLAGVQIRLPQMNDTNYEVVTPGGLRFVTSLSERLLSEIDAVSDKKVATYEGDVDVEYGYAVGTEESIAMFIDGVGINLDPPIEGHYKGVDLNKYRIQYNGKNVNGVDTSGTDAYGNRFKTDAYGNILTDANGQKIFACGHELTADNDYAYVYNINCTRGIAITDGNGSPTGVIKEDHRNCTDYRLYTLVVTYDGDSATRTSDRIDARSYIRYYDANGWLRVFYNDYENEDYFGGCMCSFDQISNMETPTYPSTHILDPED